MGPYNFRQCTLSPTKKYQIKILLCHPFICVDIETFNILPTRWCSFILTNLDVCTGIPQVITVLISTMVRQTCDDAAALLWQEIATIIYCTQHTILGAWYDPSICVNPLRAKFFRGNINISLHFVSFLHIDATQVVEILPQIRQEPT